MSRYSLKLTLVAILFVALFAAMLPANAPASAHSAGAPQAVTSGLLAQRYATAQTLAYWTPERMKAALPADKLVAGAKLTLKAPPAAGPSGSRAPLAPQHQVAPNAARLSKMSSSASYQLPPSYYKYFPFSTVGKVFFTQNGGNFVCSGDVVNSNNQSVVDTAGHCVVQGGSGGNWSSNWVFCPQYYYGYAPYGCFVARQLWTSSAWYYNGSLEDDFGEAVVSANSYGNIVSVVGGSGWAYGQSASQAFYAFGYPAAYPFDGNSVYYCADYGSAAGFDDGYAVSISCTMTGGSSGGPWLISLGGTFGYVNGHNDFKYTNDPNHMYSPYYDYDWYVVFNAAQNS